MKYQVSGWIQLTVCIDEIIEAENEEDAKNKVYYMGNCEFDVNNVDLEAELIE